MINLVSDNTYFGFIDSGDVMEHTTRLFATSQVEVG